MFGKISIFDQAERAKQQGIEAAYQHADSYWKKEAAEILIDIAKTKPEFTSDDIWEVLDSRGIHTGENRAMGAIIQSATRSRLIKHSGNYTRTRRPQGHKHPVSIYTSLIYQPNIGRREYEQNNIDTSNNKHISNPIPYGLDNSGLEKLDSK